MACPTGFVSGCDFAQYLVNQQPVFDKLIMEDIRPVDSWILNVKTGTWESYAGVTHFQDRFNSVFPDTTKQWSDVHARHCTSGDNPCDPKEYCIGWGGERKYYHLERQSWRTPLLCFDQMMHITHAREHFRQIISQILKPATTAINSHFLRRGALANGVAGNPGVNNSWAANRAMTPLSFAWATGPAGDDELFFDCNIAPDNVFLLTPQMLQRRTTRLWGEGYAGKNPFKDSPPLIELVSDIDTCWSLDRLGGSGGMGAGNNSPTTVANWRFTEWNAAHAYWRYGFSGQIGNFAIRVDPMGFRFKFVRDLGAGVGANRYRYARILPYRNVATGGDLFGGALGAANAGDYGYAAGLKSLWNPEFDAACYAISFIWHKSALECLVSDATPVNSEMPFSSRNFGGRWQFVMDNLGADCNGNPIENKRRNKGMFIADFKMALRPLYTEFIEPIFHKRELPCVYEIAPCNDCSYASYPYGEDTNNSCNTPCDCPTDDVQRAGLV